MLALVGSGLLLERGGRFTRKPTRASLLENPMNSTTVIPFDFQDDRIRALSIDGEPWFVAKGICLALGYENPRKAVADHCKGGNESLLPSAGGNQMMTIIPERDVYRLVMRSRLPSAERFEDWVVGTVLPSIRKTGRYEAPEQPRESSYMKAFKAGILFAMQLPGAGKQCSDLSSGSTMRVPGNTVTSNDGIPQPRTNRAQPAPTYHAKGEGLFPVKIAPWTHPKIEAAKADILAMPAPTSMIEIFKMLKERGVLRNRANEMAVAFILKESGLYRRRQYRVGGGGCTWVYERIAA